MKINNLQDLLKYHQDALERHQALHAKHGEQHAKYPKWRDRIQRADQCKIDFHQQAINVLVEAMGRDRLQYLPRTDQGLCCEVAAP